MDENYIWLNTVINKIEFNMIRKDDKCWIKAVPLTRLSIPSSLHIILNDDYHHWDIYDKNGIETHKIYFEGGKIAPSFYLKCGDNCYRIDFNTDKIKVVQITEMHNIETYIKENCSCVSPKASCWAKHVYFTSRPDKSPFNEM